MIEIETESAEQLKRTHPEVLACPQLPPAAYGVPPRATLEAMARAGPQWKLDARGNVALRAPRPDSQLICGNSVFDCLAPHLGDGIDYFDPSLEARAGDFVLVEMPPWFQRATLKTCRDEAYAQQHYAGRERIPSLMMKQLLRVGDSPMMAMVANGGAYPLLPDCRILGVLVRHERPADVSTAQARLRVQRRIVAISAIVAALGIMVAALS